MKQYTAPNIFLIDIHDLCEGVNPGSPTDRFDSPRVPDIYDDVMDDGYIEELPSLWDR